YATYTHHSTKEHFFYSKDTTTTTTTQSEVQGGSALFSNGSLSISADKDIRAYNLTALASEDIALQSKNGDIALSSKADTYTQDITQKIVERGFKGSLSDLSISYGTDTTTLNANKNYTTYDKSLLHGNNISINAKNNVAMNSVDLRTYEKDIAVNDLDNSQADTSNTLATTNVTSNAKNNTISINADSLTMDYLSNTYKDSYNSTMVSHRVGLKASVPILSPAVSAAYSLDSLLNTNTSSPLHSTKAKVLQSLNATLDIADTSLDIAKAANKDFNAKLSLSYTATIASSNSESTQTNALDSAIDTANLSIYTTKDTTIKGLNANITQHTDLQAQNFTLEASKNTFTSTQSSSLDSISVGASVSVGTNGVGINAEASYDNSHSNSSISSTSYNHSTLNTNSLSLRTTENTTMRGSSIKASTLSMDIGNALDIVSLQDSTSYDSSSHSLSLSASVPVYGASAPSGQASYSHSKTNATLQSTTTLSSIQADSLSINANHTNLVGSAILGNGSLNTNTLSHSNLNNTSSYDTLSTSIGTNGGYFLSNADSSTSSALATISSGIDISSKQIATTQANPSTADNTNTSLANSISTINRNPHKNNNIPLQEYTQTAIDKERENAQTISLASVLKDKANALKKDIKEMISLDDSTSQGNIANLSINAITEGIITGIVTQDFLSTATSLANPYIANGIKHITQDNPNLSPKAQFITNVLAHSAYGALAGGLSSQSIDSLSNINNTKLLNSVLSGGISAGSAPIIARLASNAIYDTTDTSSLSAKQQEIIKSIVSVSGGIIGASISSNSANSVRYASIGTNQALNEVENNSFAKTLRTIGYPALNLSWQKGRILTPQELTTIAKNATQEVVDDIEFIISNPFSTKALNSSIGVIVGVKPSEIVNGFVDTTNYIKNILTSNDTDTLIKHTSAINSTNTKIPPISIDENANKAFITTIPKSQITQSQLTQIPSNNQQQTTITTLPRHTKDIPIIRTPSGQEVSVNIYFSNKKDDIDDIEYLAKNSKYQTTSRANEIARSFGYKDAEKLKGEFVYEKGTTSKYNVHTAGKKVILVPVRKESHLKPVDTGLRLK
ncbi:hemagglutinin repeat-containing protein, partial [Helicobacter sp. MIT 01-3238]|uniref:hemagglutinin repeat-containing protein n=1 Tax=Helicobacter sp. MIT 01-3238 TaxID=398627 RepID=UPI000E36BF4D